MQYQQVLEHAIVVWMNEIKKKGLIYQVVESIHDMQDGVVFSQLLNAVDPSFFPLDQTKALLQDSRMKDPMHIHKHLLDIQNKVIQYRSNIQCKSDPFVVDVQQISNHQSIPQLLAFFEMVLRVVMSSSLKGEIIKPILDLKEKDQEALMHFLKKLLQQEDDDHSEIQDDWNGTITSEHNLSLLIQKNEEMENENLSLQNQLVDQKEEISEFKQTIKYLQTLLDSKEQDYQKLMEQTYEDKISERSQTSEQLMQHNTHEEDRLRQRILQQEHRITELELTLDDYKQKETQFRSLKEENETITKQLIQHNALKNKFETIKESRDLEKETHDRIITQKDRILANLKHNIKNILQDLSVEKEKSLELQVQHEKTKALIEKIGQDKMRTEQECEDKIKSMQRLIQLLQEEQDIHAKQMERHQSNEHNNIEVDIHKSDNKHENLQIDFYKEENQKLENRLKSLQAQLERLELEKPNKRDHETIIILNQEIDMLKVELKKERVQLLKYKVQMEDHKKQNITHEKMPQLVDCEIELLQELDQRLTNLKKQMKMDHSSREKSKI